MNQVRRTSILGAPVDCVNMALALQLIDEYIQEAELPGTVLAVNPEKVYALRENQFLKDFFTKATILIPDGIGVVMAMRLNGHAATRVPGADLMTEICEMASKRGYRIFIYGAKEEINRLAVERLNNIYPSLQIAGRANGYITEEDMDKLINQINESKADILFVALGSPRQEEWMYKYLQQLQTVRICQGVGGTLDTIVGNVKRAPLFMQRLNLEWFYRLIKQPTRARRQLKLISFVWEVGSDLIRSKLGKSRTS